MITLDLLDGFFGRARGRVLREATRYAREARVQDLGGTNERVTSLVRGRTGRYEVVLWAENGTLNHRCTCPSWRVPCKHEVAAALVLRQEIIAVGDTDASARLATVSSDEARRQALEERIVSARREKLTVRKEDPPYLRVESPSGFSYRVHLRGDESGPHSCDCPDFEANRLHTCKHVERVRRFLRAARTRLPRRYQKLARQSRIYLHLGEVVEPRLWGIPKGRGAPAVRAAFDEHGVPLRPVEPELRDLRRWLETFERWTEPDAFEWLDARIRRQPELPDTSFRKVVGRLEGELYPYQWIGAEFLARRGRALLADEMGLGKTIQAIVAVLALRRAVRPARHVTIVCPASLRGNWQDEIRRWAHEEVTLLSGSAHRRAKTIAERPPWLVTHFEQVLRDHRHHAQHPPELLIIDEAQRAKGMWTRTARVLKTIDAPYVFALTGTPLENRLEEAYAIAQLLDQRLLPPLWQIDRDHFVRDEDGRRVVLYRNLDSLRSQLAPSFLRRRKEHVALELPERIRSVSRLPMHPAVRDTYDEVMAQVARIVRKKVLLPADLDRLQRLLVIARRCCNGPHMLGLDVDDREVPKLAELEHVVRELCLGAQRKAVVFSEWTDMTDRVEALGERLGLATFHLCGSVPVRKRPALIRGFSQTEGPALFISTDAGGLGLNLQAAEVVINLNLPWNPARMEQRIARVHRIGSKRTTQEMLFVAQDTVEDRILRLHDTKQAVLDNVWSRSGEDVIAAPGGSGAFREMVAALLETWNAPAERSSPDAKPSAGEAQSEGRDDRAEIQEHVPAARAAGSNEAAGTIDPEALAAAVSAVLPSIPAEHRRSLATVFRTLAEALDGSVG